MQDGDGARWVRERLDDLLVRLRAIRLPSKTVPVVAVAAPRPEALAALEDGVRAAVRSIMSELVSQRARVAPGLRLEAVALRRANRSLTIAQLRADALFRTLDFFADAMGTRADPPVGTLLAGLDRLLEAALARGIPGYVPPRPIAYLDSVTRGGAITRARTRLPGGVVLPIAMVRVSPESLPTRLTNSLHEAGHQLSVDLGVLGEARPAIQQAAYTVLRDDGAARLWGSWASEILADCWGLLLGGGAPAVDGLQRVLSLPAPMLYSIRAGDPHPPGAIRIPLSLAIARSVHPDPLLDPLARRHDAIHAGDPMPAEIPRLAAAIAPVARRLLEMRFAGLGARRLVEVCDVGAVAPRVIGALVEQGCAQDPQRLASRPPLQALAVLGTARLRGHLDAASHDLASRAWLSALGSLPRRPFDAPPAEAGGWLTGSSAEAADQERAWS